MSHKNQKHFVVVGQRFGRLTVAEPIRATSRCVCDCGGKIACKNYYLVTGRIVSCGCYCIERSTQTAISRTVHGESHSYEHKHWWQMVRRCKDPKFPMFQKYGLLGIRVHPSWAGPDGYLRFLEHIGRAPSNKHTIDRFPDQTGNYEPGNVRWATPTEQSRNLRTNVILTAQGRAQCLVEWAEELGLDPTTISYRINKLGWSHEKALFTPLLRKRRAS